MIEQHAIAADLLDAPYHGQDVVVIGVHTPELARERVPSNVAAAVKRLGVTYPVALDLNYTIWRAFHNEYWPSVHIADRQGRLRFHHSAKAGTTTRTVW